MGEQFKPVLIKADFVRRFMTGEFGNKGPNWDSLVEFINADYKGLVHLRNRRVGGPTFYNVPSYEVNFLWMEVRHKYPNERFYLAGMAPSEKTIIQGEVQETHLGLVLTFSRAALPMRDALRVSTEVATGLRAKGFIEAHLCQRSQDWLKLLLERYPDHVVEFSTFSCNWGTIPGFNTVFWEVRKY